jgi:hypothetical protein
MRKPSSDPAVSATDAYNIWRMAIEAIGFHCHHEAESMGVVDVDFHAVDEAWRQFVRLWISERGRP